MLQADVVEDVCAMMRDALNSKQSSRSDGQSSLWWMLKFGARAVLEASKQDQDAAHRAVDRGLLKFLASCVKSDAVAQAPECVLLLQELIQGKSAPPYSHLHPPCMGTRLDSAQSGMLTLGTELVVFVGKMHLVWLAL